MWQKPKRIVHIVNAVSLKCGKSGIGTINVTMHGVRHSRKEAVNGSACDKQL